MMKKYLIVGLPRTGTTSFCAAALQLGYRTAHTAYTVKALIDAEVIADTPVFCDYQELVRLFPKSEIVLLQRETSRWLPSVKQLLFRMSKNLFSTSGGFNDTIKRCYLTVFEGLSENNFDDDAFLSTCYNRHREAVVTFCLNNNVALHHVDIDTLSIPALNTIMPAKTASDSLCFPHLNRSGKVTAWNDIRHELKVESTNAGKVDPDASLYTKLQSELCLN